MKRGHLEMNVKISEEIASYLERQPENLRGIAVRLVETILNSHPGMTAAIKWGHPSFGLHSDYHHWICSVQALKGRVALTFHFGRLLCDEQNRLVAGTSRYLRKLEYSSLDSIDEAEIEGFIQQAIEKLPYFKAHWRELSKEA